jgi:hypothetical protein
MRLRTPKGPRSLASCGCSSRHRIGLIHGGFVKNALLTLTSIGLALGACRAEPSAAPGPAEATSPAPATKTSRTTSASAPPGSMPQAGSEGQGANEAPRGRQIVETFDDDTPDAPPRGFSFARTGKGAPGKWIVKAEAGAPSGANVLAQVDPDNTNSRFPVAVLNDPILKDVRVSVRCKPVSGKVDQACGLVARYRDENNYFITRANALEDNIRLYTVRDGKRTEIASHDIEVSPNVWYDYRLDVKGDHLQVFWNGERVLDHHDGTFTEAGHVGVWTKADSITHFDNLQIEAYE